MKLSLERVTAIRAARIRCAFIHEAAGRDTAARRAWDAAARAERVWLARMAQRHTREVAA